MVVVLWVRTEDNHGKYVIHIGTQKKGNDCALRESIYFSEDYLTNVMKPHEGPLVIKVDIKPDATIEKMVIDSGSFVDVFYYDTFHELQEGRSLPL